MADLFTEEDLLSEDITAEDSSGDLFAGSQIEPQYSVPEATPTDTQDPFASYNDSIGAEAEPAPVVDQTDSTLRTASVKKALESDSYQEFSKKLEEAPGNLMRSQVMTLASEILANEADPETAYQQLNALYEKADHDNMAVDDLFSEIGETFRAAYDVDVVSDIAEMLPPIGMDYDQTLEGKLEIIDEYGDKARAQLRIMLGSNYAIHKKKIDQTIADIQESQRKYHQAGAKYGLEADPETGEAKIKKTGKLTDLAFRAIEGASELVTDGILFNEDLTKQVDDYFVTNPNYDQEWLHSFAKVAGQGIGTMAIGSAIAASGGVLGLGATAVGATAAAARVASITPKVVAWGSTLPQVMLELESVYDQAMEVTGGDKEAAMEAVYKATPTAMLDYVMDANIAGKVFSSIKAPFTSSKALKATEMARKTMENTPGLKDIRVVRDGLVEFQKLIKSNMALGIAKGVGLAAAGEAATEVGTELGSRAAVGSVDPSAVDYESTMDAIKESVAQGEYTQAATLGGAMGGLFAGMGGVITSWKMEDKQAMLKVIDKNLAQLNSYESDLKTESLDKLAKGTQTQEDANILNNVEEEPVTPPEVPESVTQATQLAELIQQEADLRSQELGFGQAGEIATKNDALATVQAQIEEMSSRLNYTKDVERATTLRDELASLNVAPTNDPEVLVRRDELTSELRDLGLRIKKSVPKQQEVVKEAPTPKNLREAEAPKSEEQVAKEDWGVNIKKPVEKLSKREIADEFESLYNKSRAVNLPSEISSRRDKLAGEINKTLAPKIEAIEIPDSVTNAKKSTLETHVKLLSMANKSGLNLSKNQAEYLTNGSRVLGELNKTPNVNVSKNVFELKDEQIDAELGDLATLRKSAANSFLMDRKNELLQEKELRKQIVQEANTAKEVNFKKPVSDLTTEQAENEILALETAPYDLSTKESKRLKELKARTPLQSKVGATTKSYNISKASLPPPLENISGMKFNKATDVLKSFRKRRDSGLDAGMNKNPKEWNTFISKLEARVDNLGKTVTDKVYDSLSTKQKDLVEKGESIQEIENLRDTTRDPEIKSLLNDAIDKIASTGKPLGKPKKVKRTTAKLQEGEFASSTSDVYAERQRALPERARVSQTTSKPIVTHPTANVDPIIELNSNTTKEYKEEQKKYPKIVVRRNKDASQTPNKEGKILRVPEILKKMTEITENPTKLRWLNLSSDGSIMGKYNGRLGFIATSLSNDLQTAAHEISHALSHKFGIVDAWVQENRFDEELQKFWVWGTPTNDRIYQRIEGVAEYFRAYMNNPEQTAKLAPKYTQYIRENIDPEVMEKIDNVSVMMQDFVNQHDADLISAKIATVEQLENSSTGLLDRSMGLDTPGGTWMKTMEKIGAVFGNDNINRAAVRLSGDLTGNRELDLKMSENPSYYKMIMRKFGSVFEEILTSGIPDPKGLQLVEGQDGLKASDYTQKMLFDGGIGKLAQHAEDADLAVEPYMIQVDTIGQAKRIKEKGQPILEIINDLKLDPNSSDGQYLIQTLSDELRDVKKEIRAFKLDNEEPPKELVTEQGKLRTRLENIKKEPTKENVEAELKNHQDALSRLAGYTGQIDPKNFNDLTVVEGTLKNFYEQPAQYIDAIEKGIELHREFATATLNFGVEMGYLNREKIDETIANNEEYYAMQRFMSDGLEGNVISDNADLLKKWKGSTRDTIPGYMSLIEHAFSIIQASYANKLNQTSIDLFNPDVVGNDILKLEINRTRENAGLPPLTPTELEKAVKDEATISIFGATLKGLDQMAFKLSEKPSGKLDTLQVITLYRNGQPEYWKIPDKVFYDGIRSFRSNNVKAVPLLTPFMNFFKASVTGTVAFAVRNLGRDFNHRTTFSNSGLTNSATSFAGAIQKAFTEQGTKDFTMLKRWGGDNSGWMMKDDVHHFRSLLSIFENDPSVKKGFVMNSLGFIKKWNILYNPEFSSLTERVGRQAGFDAAFTDAAKQAKEAGMSPADIFSYAAYQATDNMDFSNVSESVRKINQYTLFFAPSVVAISKALHSAKTNPTMTVYKLAALTAVTVGIQKAMAAMGDYEDELDQIPNYMKGMTIPIKVADNTWLYIPLDYTTGFFHSLLSRVYDYGQGKADAFKGMDDNFYNAFVPFELSSIGGPLGAIGEAIGNYSQFKGSKIVPEYDEKLRLKHRSVPTEASYAAQFLHKAFIDLGIDDVESVMTFGDARKIDYLIQAIGGSTSSIASKAFDLTKANKRRDYLTKLVGIAGPGFVTATKDYEEIKDFLGKEGFGFNNKEFKRIGDLRDKYFEATNQEDKQKYGDKFRDATAKFKQVLLGSKGNVLLSPTAKENRNKKAAEKQQELKQLPSLF